MSGVTKSLNQLSLGVIDISEPESKANPEVEPAENVDGKDPSEAPDFEPINVLAPAKTVVEEPAEVAHYDGYIAASTNGRAALSKAAFALVAARPGYFLFGTGIGSGGNAIYQNYIDPGYIKDEEIKKTIKDAGVDIPSLNVQSEYAELFLEFGIIGAILAAIAAFIYGKEIIKHKDRIFFIVLAVAYLVAFAFCSGLTNSLYLYLFIPIFLVALKNYPTKYVK